MKLSLIVTEDCAACKRAETSLRKLINRYNGAAFEVININEYNGNSIAIVPALLINEEIFSFGEIEENKLLKILSNSFKDKNE